VDRVRDFGKQRVNERAEDSNVNVKAAGIHKIRDFDGDGSDQQEDEFWSENS
jgi:hypothetical protein